MKTNNNVRVGVNYTVQTLHDVMRGIITEHWSGKSYPFWLERCDSGVTLYDTEAPLPLAKEVVDSFSDIGYYVPEDFYNTQKDVENA